MVGGGDLGLPALQGAPPPPEHRAGACLPGLLLPVLLGQAFLLLPILLLLFLLLLLIPFLLTVLPGMERITRTYFQLSNYFMFV